MAYLWRNYSFIIIFIVMSTIMGLVLIYSMIDEGEPTGHTTVQIDQLCTKEETYFIQEQRESCSDQKYHSLVE